MGRTEDRRPPVSGSVERHQLGPNAEQRALQAELRLLLGKRTVAALDATPTPILDRVVWAAEGLEHGAGLSQPRTTSAIQRAIAGLPEGRHRQAAAALLANLGAGGSIKERGTQAAAAFGLGYDAFRRRIDGSSRMDEVLELVAGELLALESKTGSVSPDSATPSLPEDEPGEGRRWYALAAAIVLVIGVILLVALWNRGNDPSEPSDEPAAGVADSSTGAAAAEGGSAGRPFDGSPVLGEVEAICGFDAGELDDPSSAVDDFPTAFADAYEQSGGREALGCPAEPMTLRGGLFWQELRRFDRANGGLLGLPNGEVMVMNVGQWRSYIRVGGGDGSLSQSVGGTPTGRVLETSDGWQLELDSEVELLAEGVDGTYYWLPPLALAEWNAAGRSGGIHGPPAGSPRRSPEGIRQDFANGYFLLTASGHVQWTALPNPGQSLPATTDLPGRIITAADGTAWLVDSDLRRWWLPDPQVYFCAGGDLNALIKELPGYAIHTLDYGGVLTCPARLVGVTPAGGGIVVNEYCGWAVAAGTIAERVADGWACTDGVQSQPVDVTDVCRWQYGPDATGVEDPDDPLDWSCKNPG